MCYLSRLAKKNEKKEDTDEMIGGELGAALALVRSVKSAECRQFEVGCN